MSSDEQDSVQATNDSVAGADAAGGTTNPTASGGAGEIAGEGVSQNSGGPQYPLLVPDGDGELHVVLQGEGYAAEPAMAARVTAEVATAGQGGGGVVQPIEAIYRIKSENERPGHNSARELPAVVLDVDDEGRADLRITNGDVEYQRNGVRFDRTGEAPRSWRPKV